MNHLFNTAIASLQLDPNMVITMMKTGEFLEGDIDLNNAVEQVCIEDFTLLSTFENIIPAFYNPDLKLFLMALVWDDKGQFSLVPTEIVERLQFVFGKKNTRRLKTRKLNLLTEPSVGTLNMAVWVMEVAEGIWFADIDHEQIGTQINKSLFRQTLRQAARKGRRPSKELVTENLKKLQVALTKKIPYIEKLHPILELTLKDGKQKIEMKNEFVEIVIKIM